MILEGNVMVQCNNCGHVQLIDKDYFDDSVSSWERNMGPEIEHEFAHDCNCELCGQDFFVRLYGYEYPEGAFNYQNSEADGCRIIYEPSIDIEQYDFDFPRGVGSQIINIAEYYDALLQNIVSDRETLYRMPPYEFEDLVAEIFRRDGYDVKVTPRTRDGGKDIIASFNKNGIPYLLYIECKRYTGKHKVGVEIVQRIFGTQTADRVGKSVVVTSSTFSRDARHFAEEQNHMIDLLDYNDLIRMVEAQNRQRRY